ncbi:MAG: tetratricopeptide repeat protein [Nitrospinae bacterium]|nr:tetratricopeptide repeat protein [Nitrospinota bacterium]
MRELLIAALILLSSCATSDTKKFISSVPSEGGKFVSRGDESLQKGEVREAARKYGLAVLTFQKTDDLKGMAAAYLRLARTALLKRDAEDANKYFVSAKTICEREKLSEFKTDVAVLESTLLSSSEKNAEAEETLKKATAGASGEDADKLDNARGKLLLSSGKAEEAKGYFTRVLSKTKNPDLESAAHYNMAQALLKTGDADKALAQLFTALELDKKSAATINIGDTLYLIGTAYEAKKSFDDARYYYQRALMAHAQVDLPEKAEADKTALSALPAKQ